MAAVNTIGSMEFNSMQCESVPAYAENIRELTRPGVHGHIYIKEGKRGQPFPVRTLAFFHSETAAAAAAKAYQSMQGDYTSANINGSAYAKIMVLAISCSYPRKTLCSTANYKYILEASWTLQRNS